MPATELPKRREGKSRSRAQGPCAVEEFVDEDVTHFQVHSDRGGPPLERIFRRITYIFRTDEFHQRRHEGVKVEEQEGDILEDLEIDPGTVTEKDLQKPIADHL